MRYLASILVWLSLFGGLVAQQPLIHNDNGNIYLLLNSESATEQGVAASVLGPLASRPNSQVRAFDTYQDAVGAAVFGRTSVIFTYGYNSIGDGGGAMYVERQSDPGHPGSFQTADGRWWELLGPRINVLSLGALGDDDPNSAATNNTAFRDAEHVRQRTGYPTIYIPPGVYQLDPGDTGTRMTANGWVVQPHDGDTILIEGAGAASSILKFSDSIATTASAFWHLLLVRMWQGDSGGLLADPSLEICDSVTVRNLGFDGNYRNITPPSPADAYEQRSMLKVQNSPTGTRNHIRRVTIRDIDFHDRVAGGIQVGPSTGVSVDSSQADLDGGAGNNTEGLIGVADVANVHGNKLDAKRGLVTFGSGVGVINMSKVTSTDKGGANVNWLECEFTIVPADLIVRLNVADCHVGSLDLAGVAGSDDQLVADVKDSTFLGPRSSNVNRCVARVRDCHLRIANDVSWLAHDVIIENSRILHDEDGAGDIYSIVVQDNSGQNKLKFKKCEFLVNATSLASANSPAVDTKEKVDITNYLLEMEECFFDPLMAFSVDMYAGGRLVTRGCTFANSIANRGAIRLGSFSSFVSAWEDYGSDFTACTDPFRIEAHTVGATDIELRGGRFNDPDWTENDGGNDWTDAFNHCHRQFTVTAKPSGGGIVGDEAVLDEANYVVGGPRGWMCTASHPTSGTWVPFGWEDTSSTADPSTTEYPNSGDQHFHENTTTGNWFWAINDGGTILKVQVQ